jgi:NAD(P)-dependent dehydrogenase (short-subunit alcohol dehydrogenase family)
MAGPRVAIVTGAGSGIGRAAALALLKDGYSVALLGRHADSLNGTREQAGDTDRALAIVCDVRDEASVDDAFAETVKVFGRLDVLFNNAGIAAPGPIEDLSLEAWNAVIGINLTGAFLCTRAAVRIMKSQAPKGGRIINNGSISSYSPRPNSAPYTASKHAILGLTRSTSLDGRKHDIACSQLDIGNADTALVDKIRRGTLQANGQVAPEAVMDVKEVARAVVYIASLPLDANVQNMTLMATKMPFIGRG